MKRVAENAINPIFLDSSSKNTELGCVVCIRLFSKTRKEPVTEEYIKDFLSGVLAVHQSNSTGETRGGDKSTSSPAHLNGSHASIIPIVEPVCPPRSRLPPKFASQMDIENAFGTIAGELFGA
jgi:hypothetical protein